MAVLTPSNVFSGSLGSYRLVIARFATMDTGDTWVSGLKNEPVKAYWTQDRDNPTTQGSVGVAAAYVAGTGVFTFYPAENAKATVDLFVLIGL